MLVICFQHSCASKPREELKAVPSKHLRALPRWKLLFVVNNISSCHDCIRPGNRFAFSSAVFPATLHFHSLPSEGLAFQVGQAAQGEQQKPGPPKKKCAKTNLNKKQQRRPSVSSSHELWLSEHTVPAHQDRMIFGFSTLGLSKAFTQI